MIKLEISYYNEKHKILLEGAPFQSKLEDAIKNGIEISKDEFAVYTIFREQKQRPGWITYAELKEKMPSRLNAFSDYFDLSTGTITSKFSDSAEYDNTHTESAGVGVALSIVSKLYDLTEADWQKIPISNNKDMDFEIASDGNNMIEIEAKGTISNAEKPTSNISNHKRDIEEKKSNNVQGVVTIIV